MAEIIEKVERHLGFFLKEKQREVFAAFVKGNNVFDVLPTGFGKTLSVSTDNAVNSIVNIICECLTPISQVCIVLKHKSGTFFQHIHHHHGSIVINININLQFIKSFCY